jgi:hypothetical protein
LMNANELDAVMSVESMTRPGITGAGRAGGAGEGERGDKS